MTEIHPGPIPQEQADNLAAVVEFILERVYAWEDLNATAAACPGTFNPKTIEAAAEALASEVRGALNNTLATLKAYAGASQSSN